MTRAEFVQLMYPSQLPIALSFLPSLANRITATAIFPPVTEAEKAKWKKSCLKEDAQGIVQFDRIITCSLR